MQDASVFQTAKRLAVFRLRQLPAPAFPLPQTPDPSLEPVKVVGVWTRVGRGGGGRGGGGGRSVGGEGFLYIGQSDDFKNMAKSTKGRRQRLLQLWQFNFFVDVVDVDCLAGFARSCEICA